MAVAERQKNSKFSLNDTCIYRGVNFEITWRHIFIARDDPGAIPVTQSAF